MKFLANILRKLANFLDKDDYKTLIARFDPDSPHFDIDAYLYTYPVSTNASNAKKELAFYAKMLNNKIKEKEKNLKPNEKLNIKSIELDVLNSYINDNIYIYNTKTEPTKSLSIESVNNTTIHMDTTIYKEPTYDFKGIVEHDTYIKRHERQLENSYPLSKIHGFKKVGDKFLLLDD